MLTAQVHQNNGEWHLCHTSCDLLDAGKLSDWLSAIKSWMDANPNDGASSVAAHRKPTNTSTVVTVLLVNSDNASAQDLDSQFKSSGITKYSYTPTSTTAVPSSWPTLQELISANTRLLTFVASLSASSNTVAPYLMDEFTYIWENPFDNSNAANFSCLPDRPTIVKGSISAATSSGRMSLMNHFLYSTQAFGIEEPDVQDVNRTNSPSGGVGALGTTASKCKTDMGKAPTFILVDFFDQGPAIATVDQLNGITAVGRTSVPSTNTEASPTSGAGKGKDNIFKGLSDLTNTVSKGAKPSIGNWIWVGGNWGANLGAVSI
jgi:hypothetical protein